MAEVNDVSLCIEPGSNGDKRKVTVSYNLTFAPSEAGKKFKVAIGLVGDDPPGDEEPAPLFLTAQPFYMFTYGLSKNKFTTVTAQAGEQSFTETRELDRTTLDEDPGSKSIDVAPGTKIKIPHTDDVYARVSLAHEARSSTVDPDSYCQPEHRVS